MKTQQKQTNGSFTAGVIITLIIAGLAIVFYFGSFFYAAMTPPGIRPTVKNIFEKHIASQHMKARETSRQNECRNNLRLIEAAKDQFALENGLTNGATISFAPLVGSDGLGYLKNWPFCPDSTNASAKIRTQSMTENDYDINVIGSDPKCRIHPENHVLSSVADGLAQQSTETAAKRALQLPKGNERRTALADAADGRAEKDPENEAAAKRVLQQPAGKARDSAIGRVASAWAQKDPEAATKWAFLQLPDGIARYSAISFSTTVWAEKDPMAAAKWALQLPEGQSRDWALNNVATGWAKKDPEAAVNWALQLPEGNPRIWSLLSAAFSWSAANPEAAAKWAFQLPEGSERKTALAGVADGWAYKDPEAANKWAQQLPEGKERDAAIGRVAMLLARKDPAAALKLAQQLPEGKTRDQALSNIRAVSNIIK